MSDIKLVNVRDFLVGERADESALTRLFEDMSAIDRAFHTKVWGLPNLATTPQWRLAKMSDSRDVQVDYVVAYVQAGPVGFLSIELPMQENTSMADFAVCVFPGHEHGSAVTQALYRELDKRLVAANRTTHVVFIEYPGHPIAVADSAAHPSDSATKPTGSVAQTVGTMDLPGENPGRPVLSSTSGHGGLWLDAPEVSTMVERGFELAQVMVFSELKLTGVDAPTLPAGVIAKSWKDAVPTELEDAVIELANEFQQTMPQGGAEFEPEVYDSQRWRRREEMRQAQGVQTFSTILFDGNTPVAWTAFDYHPESGIAFQEETVTLRSVRGRGFAALVKSANAAFMAAQVPTGTAIYTWNAHENTPMRAVNRKVGYKELGPVGMWQRKMSGAA